MRIPRYEVYQGNGGDWRWRLIAANGEITGQGEGYTRKHGAVRGVEANRRAATIAVVRILDAQGKRT